MAKIRYYFIVFAFSALILTQSISGLLGVPIFVILYVFAKPKVLFTSSYLPAVIVLLTFVGLFLDEIIGQSERLVYYYATYESVFTELRAGVNDLSFDQQTQMANIFPLYKYMTFCSGENISRCTFGSGLASSAFANSEFLGEGLVFPHALFVRLVYETGIIGFFLYSYVFVCLIKQGGLIRFTSDPVSRNDTVNWGVFLLSAILAHKSNNLWMYCLILIATKNMTANNLMLVRQWLIEDKFMRIIFIFKGRRQTIV